MHSILVIDDEPLILASIVKALLRVGYDVISATDMKDFREALSSHKIDLIIMDLHLKDINTVELIKEAEKILPSPKFLTISGSVPRQNQKYFLQKPFRIDTLREKVREILNEPS